MPTATRVNMDVAAFVSTLLQNLLKRLGKLVKFNPYLNSREEDILCLQLIYGRQKKSDTHTHKNTHTHTHWHAQGNYWCISLWRRYVLTLLPVGSLEHFGPWFALYGMQISTQTTWRHILENSNCRMFYHSLTSFITLSSTSKSSYQYHQRYVRPIVTRVFTFPITTFSNLFQISHFWNCRACEEKNLCTTINFPKAHLSVAYIWF